MKNDPANRFQEFKVRRICPITGKMLEMPILMIKRHFLLAHQAFKKHTGDRTLIPYLTDSEYRFLFEGISTSVPALGAQAGRCPPGTESRRRNSTVQMHEKNGRT
jgi:hypothetical protein